MVWIDSLLGARLSETRLSREALELGTPIGRIKREGENRGRLRLRFGLRLRLRLMFAVELPLRKTVNWQEWALRRGV